MQLLKKTHYNRDNKVTQITLVWAFRENGGKYNSQISIIYMNLETRSLRCRPRNRWHDEAREDGRIVGGEVWQEKVYN